MSKRYEIEIDGRNYSITTGATSVDVIIDGVAYTLTFSGDEVSYAKNAIAADRLEMEANTEWSAPASEVGSSTERVAPICMVCNGELICSFGRCVRTACGEFCR